VVLIDAKMPRLDGYAVCAAVRADPGIRRQPHIIMLTGSADAADRDRAQAAGANEFISKPFSPLHIVALVRAACDRPPAVDAAGLQGGSSLAHLTPAT
jgi:CheY-like chemotaxis protein